MTRSPYVFAETAHGAELERLRVLESVFDPGTRQCLLATGLGPGWRCLEVGAGAGSVARWLADTTGPGGHVLAVDPDTRFLAGPEFPNLEVRQVDVRAADLEPASFDLAHARFVFIHVPDWRAALAATLRALRPGGWLVLEEPDFSAFRSFSGPPELRAAFDRVHRAIEAMFAARGLDHAFGARLPALFQDHGLANLAADHHAPIVPGGSPLATMMELSTRQLASAYLATGRVTPEDLERYAAFTADPNCWALYHATLRTAGRKSG